MDDTVRAAAQWTAEHSMNAIGCAIFWLYILFALIFTSLILDSLYLRLSAPTAPLRRRADSIFTALAAISFLSLSFNMLHFLIKSYQHWQTSRIGAGINASSTPKGVRALLGKVSTWSLTSTLFHDFGRDIVQTNARFVWTLAALWITFAVVIQLVRRGIPDRIPRPWAFIGLSQILPVSFIQNLLYVARLRGSQASAASSSATTFEQAIFAVAVVYTALPFALPSATDNAKFMLIIALLRAALLAPPVVSMLQDNARPQQRRPRSHNLRLEALVTALGVAACSTQLYLAMQEFSLVEIGRALFASPAVSALGIDCLIGVISRVCWSIFGEGSVR